jgi:hypothetical protein
MNSHQKKNRVEDSSLHHQDDPSVLPQSAAPQQDKSKPFQPKKLRFITNQGAPQAKRRRVSTACLLCRKRKVACSGERPRCNTCMNNKLLCTGYAHENATPENNHANDSNETRVAPPTMSRPEAAKPVIAPPPLDSYPSYFHRPLPSLFSGSRNRMPYFRWLGPTAIMPGFKQMVVKINNSSSNPDAVTSPSVNAQPGASTSIHSATYDPDARTPQALPFYDNSSMPPSELITHLCHVFFVHLACNFPFLQRHRFLKDLEEKQVDTILVDAVCALAARFSTHHLLIQQGHDGHAVNHSEQGSAFAQRAKVALIDTYSTPSVAAVQAALLLAYNEFGESRDSGLWMYLGISIRLAQDLGLHKLDGLRYEGRDGSTPRCTAYDKIQEPSTGRVESDDQDDDVAEEQRAAERERVDTFWAVFFLDRVVSSGTGRRSTLQDDDIEISFPPLELLDAKTGWPSPFPALIRIVCLYGRVADLLNSIKEPSDITDETPQQLADMEARVTNFYQGLCILHKCYWTALNCRRSFSQAPFSGHEFPPLCQGRRGHQLCSLALLVPHFDCTAPSTDFTQDFRRRHAATLPKQSGSVHVFCKDNSGHSLVFTTHRYKSWTRKSVYNAAHIYCRMCFPQRDGRADRDLARPISITISDQLTSCKSRRRAH